MSRWIEKNPQQYALKMVIQGKPNGKLYSAWRPKLKLVDVSFTLVLQYSIEELSDAKSRVF